MKRKKVKALTAHANAADADAAAYAAASAADAAYAYAAACDGLDAAYAAAYDHFQEAQRKLRLLIQKHGF